MYSSICGTLTAQELDGPYTVASRLLSEAVHHSHHSIMTLSGNEPDWDIR